MTDAAGHRLIAAYLVLCLLAGGASGGGVLANMALQLAALPILAWAFLSAPVRPNHPSSQLMTMMYLLAALIVIQLVPMPPELWLLLPGRDFAGAGYELLGLKAPWLPISLAPYKTIASAVWLLPSLAILAAMVRCGSFRATSLGWAVVIAASCSVPLAILQATSEGSGWALYKVSDLGLARGFFPNARHFSLLLLVSLPVVAGLYLAERQRQKPEQKASGALALILVPLFAILVGLAFSASLVVAGLLLPTIIACTAMFKRSRGKISRRWGASIVALAMLYVGLTSMTSFANEPIWEERFGLVETRSQATAKAAEAALNVIPLGAGAGVFSDIYRQHEDVGEVGRIYLNHAHNDYLEIVVEAGLPGLALIVMFLIWWWRRTMFLWVSDEASHIARAATIVTGLTLVQSAVDFPLRTAAIGSLFAAGCALMAQPRRKQKRRARTTDHQREPRHLSAD